MTFSSNPSVVTYRYITGQADILYCTVACSTVAADTTQFMLVTIAWLFCSMQCLCTLHSGRPCLLIASTHLSVDSQHATCVSMPKYCEVTFIIRHSLNSYDYNRGIVHPAIELQWGIWQVSVHRMCTCTAVSLSKYVSVASYRVFVPWREFTAKVDITF